MKYADRPKPVERCPGTMLQVFTLASKGEFAEASQLCDMIHLWHRDRIADAQAMFLKVQEDKRRGEK